MRHTFLFLCLFICLHAKSQLTGIPANDNDIQQVLDKIPAIRQFTNSCNEMKCPAVNCDQLKNLHNRLRDARMYLKYLHFWLRRAADAHLDHIKSIANESMIVAWNAGEIHRLAAWQEYVKKIAEGLLEMSSAGSNFQEILMDPKLLASKSKGEMIELFDKFYEGMKDSESFIGRLAEDRHHAKFPQFFNEMLPTFGLLTDEQMSTLKSHLSDFYSLMKSINQYGDDWKKVMKEGKGLVAVGQIAGRFLKAYLESDIKARHARGEALYAQVLTNNQVQSKTYMDWHRLQERRNKAEDALRAVEDLIIFESGGKGWLARCLIKHGSTCMNVDLSYTSKVTAPAEFSVSNFSFAVEEDKRKSYANALTYFNGKLPEVVSLLTPVPVMPTENKFNSLGPGKKSYGYGEPISINFTAAPCLPKEAWIGIFSVFAPQVDDINAGQHLLSARARIEGRSSGTVSFQSLPDGAYEARMFDYESGKHVASTRFNVGKESYALSGIYKNIKSGDLWKLEVYDLGFSLRFGGWKETDGENWQPWITGGQIVTEDKVLYRNEVGCGYGPTGNKVGEIKEIPFRLVFDQNKKSFKVQNYKVNCDGQGKLHITNTWVDDGDVFMRIGD